MKLTAVERLEFSRLPEVCNSLDKNKNCLGYTVYKLGDDCADVRANFKTGKIEYVLEKSGKVWIVGDFAECKTPQKYEVWKGVGYTGGHTSQSKWDTCQHGIECARLISLGYSGIDQTTEGNTSGYYPEIWYWKS